MRSRHPGVWVVLALLLTTSIVGIVAEQTPQQQEQFQEKLKENEAAQDHGERPPVPNLTSQVIDEAPAATLASGTGDVSTIGIVGWDRLAYVFLFISTISCNNAVPQATVLVTSRHSAMTYSQEKAGLLSACKNTLMKKPMATWKVCDGRVYGHLVRQILSTCYILQARR